jgi:4-methoxybenzoate monooxygenase (O-demethylating)
MMLEMNVTSSSRLKRGATSVPWINTQCAREALSPAGLGAIIWAAVDAARSRRRRRRYWCARYSRSDSTPPLSASATRSTPSPSNPTQWQVPREKPALMRPAFDEVLRWESPIQTFFRTTTRTVDIGGVEIPQDAKVLLFLASANRDPRRWNKPERFDINRRATGHVAFGASVHLCVGQMLARLEAEMFMTALAARVERIDIVGEPQRS